MSSTDPMREDSSTQYETTQKTFASTVSLSSEAKHKVIIIDEADNTGNDVQLLLKFLSKSLQETVDSSSLATTKTKSSNLSTQDVRWLTLVSEGKKSSKSQLLSSKDLTMSWTKKGLKLIRKY